jgi:hypothetical protein
MAWIDALGIGGGGGGREMKKQNERGKTLLIKTKFGTLHDAHNTANAVFDTLLLFLFRCDDVSPNVREWVHFFGLRWDGERSACERKGDVSRFGFRRNIMREKIKMTLQHMKRMGSGGGRQPSPSQLTYSGICRLWP